MSVDEEVKRSREDRIRYVLGEIILSLIRKNKSVTISRQDNVFGSTFYMRCTDIKSGKAKTVTQSFTENQIVDVVDIDVVVDAIIYRMP